MKLSFVTLTVARFQPWEVLNGVGVDGVGVIFPFFYAFFPFFFLRIFPLFLRFSLLLLKDKGKQQQFTAKMGNFTPTPSAPTPCKTSRQPDPTFCAKTQEGD